MFKKKASIVRRTSSDGLVGGSVVTTDELEGGGESRGGPTLPVPPRPKPKPISGGDGMPDWKRKVLEEKARKAERQSGPQARKDSEAAARKAKVDAMPAWMQKLAKK
jgi:hypothetical protein